MNPFSTILFLVIFFFAAILPHKAGLAQDVRHDPALYFQIPDSMLNKDTTGILHTIRNATAIKDQEPDSAIMLYKEALQQSYHISFAYGVMNSLPHLCELYEINGWVLEKYNLLREALMHCAQQPPLYTALPVVYNSIANTLQTSGRTSEAAAYYHRAINAANKIFPEYSEAIYTNFSGLLIENQQEEKALFYLAKAEKQARKNRNWNVVILSLINQAGALNELKEHKKALPMLEEALQLAHVHQMPNWEYLAQISKANTWYLQGDYQKSLAVLKHPVKDSAGIKPFYLNAGIMLTAKTYLELKDYRQAIHYFRRSLQQAEELHIVRDLLEAHKNLAWVYGTMQKFPEAYYHQSRLTLLKDSIRSQQNQQYVYNLEVRFRTSEKDKQLYQQQLELARKDSHIRAKNAWIISISGGALLLAVILALMISLYRINRQKQRLQDEQLRNLQQEQEITQLKATVRGEEQERARLARDLHDGIVSQLSAIKMNFGIIQHHPDDPGKEDHFNNTLQQLDETILDLRKTAHNLMPELLLQKGLGEAAQIFCHKMNTGQPEIEYQLFSPVPRLHTDVELMLYRTIQELVQNIIKHARATHALVQLGYHQGLLTITVEDNGVGLNAAHNGDHTGTGIRNITTRIKALNGIFDIRDNNPGTTVYIELETSPAENPEAT